MNAIVCQEMREACSLAYSAWAALLEPSKWNRPYTYMAYIATQNDKLMDAINAISSVVSTTTLPSLLSASMSRSSILPSTP